MAAAAAAGARALIVRDWEVWTPKLDAWTLVCACGATFVLPRGVLTECPRCRILLKPFPSTGGNE